MSSKEQANLSDVAMEKELLCIWRRALKNDNLTIDNDFFECGGDSLLATQVLLEVEKLTGKSLPSSIIFETGTVRQLLKKVIATDKIKSKVSVLIGSVNGKIIHFFHGDFDHGGVSVKTFSKILGTDYLIHAIAPHLPHEGKLPNSIEDMAKERLSKILEKQPDGPYILLGHCNGALVGFEAARQLILMGKEVKALVMVDPLIMSVRKSAQFIFITADFFMHLMGVHKSKRRKHMIWIWRKLVGLDRRTKDIWRRALFFFQKTWPQKRTSLKKMLEFIGRLLYIKKISHEFKERENIDQHYFNVFFNYKPLSLNVPVLYISLQYSGYAWRRITRNTVFINIYRGHHTSWKENYSQDIVDKIREFIKR
jgi:thioesterase domain-containing protein/acyl carrier protein